MRALATIAALFLAVVLLLLAFPAVVDTSVTGSAWSADLGQLFTVLPLILGLGLILVAGGALLMAVFGHK